MEWTNVNDKKPQIGENVLVIQDPETTATRKPLFAVWDGVNFKPPTLTFVNGAAIESRWVDIIYWMSLPEPPKP